MVVLLILRNIVRNKKNSLVLIALIGVITFIFFIGNSLLGRTDQGLREAYVESLTGDVVIQRKGDVTMNLFGANTPIIDSFFTIPTLPAYDNVYRIAAEEPGVRLLTSQVSSKAYMDLAGTREPALLCGVDAASYFPLFDGIELTEGAFLQSGEYGAMITETRAQHIQALTGKRPAIGEPVLLTSGSMLGFKIREVPLKGIYRYRNPGQYMTGVVIVDVQTCRILRSIQVAAAAEEAAADGDADLLSADLDALFADDAIASADAAADEEGLTIESLEQFLDSRAGEDDAALVGGDWDFIIIRLNEGVSPALVISSLNKKLDNFGALAVGWRIAAGQSAILLLLIQTLFNAGIVIVSAAGVIAAVNILLISLFKRTREIGTLRAIGAGDALIRMLVMGENLILSVIAGALGVACGAAAIRHVNGANYRIPNTLIASLLGGETLTLAFLPGVAFSSMLVALFLGAAASVYPVEAAVRIDPIVAVRRG